MALELGVGIIASFAGGGAMWIVVRLALRAVIREELKNLVTQRECDLRHEPDKYL